MVALFLYIRLFPEDFLYVANLAPDFSTGFLRCAAGLHVAALGCSANVLFRTAFYLLSSAFDFVFCARFHVTDSSVASRQVVNCLE